MELQTIGQVSAKYGISVRTLHYYEQIGLIETIRNNDNGYRFYDETALKRLNFIIILRKLRVSVKQIIDVLNNQDASVAVEIFEQNISELDEEITSLSAAKSILTYFAKELREKADIQHFDLLNDTVAVSVINSLSFSKNYINNVKENLSMENLNKANKNLKKLTDRDVRIIYLPPATVASLHHIGCSPQGEIPESTTGVMMREFIKNNNLAKIKPDLRHYGFNHPDNPHNSEKHGYERLITIPEDMVVPEPFVKKQFLGGLYAAYTITGEDWEECPLIGEWVENSEQYEVNYGAPECMSGGLEEYLNHINLNLSSDNYYEKVWQVDILIPVKEK